MRMQEEEMLEVISIPCLMREVFREEEMMLEVVSIP